MSNDDRDKPKKELEDDDLLDRLMPDPNNPDLNVLVGVFLGRAPDAKSARLYTSLRLNQYFQVPRDKVLGAKRFPSGRIAIWIPGDLRAQLVTSNSLPGDFLKGGIQSAFRGRAGGTGSLGSLAAMVGGGGTSWGGCPTDLPFDPDCPIVTTTSPSLCGPSTGCSC
jgi:hypothetical protein